MMNTASNASPSPEGQRQLETLRRAVSHALEKKGRLGQYAVIWRKGKPVRVGEETPPQTSGP